MSLVDDLLNNPDVARILCVAVALEANKNSAEVDSKELATAFSRLVRRLDRKAFTNECRQLERLGPKRYLASVQARLQHVR